MNFKKYDKEYREMTLSEKLRYKHHIFELCGEGNGELPNLLKEAAVRIEALEEAYENEFKARLQAEKERDIYRLEYEKAIGEYDY